MSSMRSAVRDLQVLVMVIAFGVGVGIEDNECALNQFRAAWPVGNADVMDGSNVAQASSCLFL